MELCVGEWRPQYLQAKLIPAAFAAQAASSPNSPCLVSEDGTSLTFAQVDSIATALARRLAAAGVQQDVAVGILLDRSPAVVVSMVAIHKAGGCYVPLDPNFPADRLSIYLEDSESRALITEPHNKALATSLITELPHMPKVLLYDDAVEAAATAAVSLPDVSLMQPSDLAYIMFTSGSTGRPKGVMVTHGGVRDLVAFNIERFGLGPKDVFCLNSTVGFDSYVTYVFASLALGARLVVPGPTAHLDPAGMAQLISTYGITTMECVPALASEYMSTFRAGGKGLSCLKRFLTGGEALTPKLAQDVYASLPGLAGADRKVAKHSSVVGLFNSYGPTEVTVTTITGHVTAPFEHITMGLPDHNVHTYVVIDSSNQEDAPANSPPQVRLAAIGEPGELWLSGPRLARGYRNRPDMTAKTFVPNPFFSPATASLSAVSGAPAALIDELREHYRIAYRTGDLVQMNADGTIDFLGRVDRQVKVNGVRMEVGEIENVLAGAPGVTHAAVKPWKDSNGAYRLVGYVAPDDVDLGAADAYLRSKLLPAMVPSKLVSMAQMPRLPNGKIDVKTLEEPDWGPAAADLASSGTPGKSAAPSTALEKIMAETWSEVLGLPQEQLDIHANFFQLGGSSLRAGLINSRVRRSTGLDVPGMLIYTAPTIHGLCHAIEEMYGSYPAASATRTASVLGPFGAIPEVDGAVALDDSSMGQKRLKSHGSIRNGAAAKQQGMGTGVAGLLQFLGYMFAGITSFVLFLPNLLVLYWLFGYLRAAYWVVVVASPVVFAADVLFIVAFLLATKWVLLGRVKPGTVPIWGWFYVRWWVVRLVYKQSMAVLFPLLRNTPLMNGIFWALGAKVGRNVTIDTFHVSDWDLLEIGDNVALEGESHVEGSSFHASSRPGHHGTIRLCRTTIGTGCTVLPQAIISAGTNLDANMILTPGMTSARPPAEPSSRDEHNAVRTERGSPSAFLWVTAVTVLILVQSFMWLALIPSLSLWYGLNANLITDNWRDLLSEALRCWLRQSPKNEVCMQLWWTEIVALLLMPASAVLGSLVYMWLLVPLKWLLVGRITPEKMAHAGGFYRLRHHIWRNLLRGPFTSMIHIWTSTEVYNSWMRAMGAKIGKQAWLAEFFRCSEFEMYEVGDAASVCSMVTVVGSTVDYTAKVTLGEGCDVTNDCTLMPGCTIGPGAVLGVYTYARPGQEFAPYSITAGDFTLRPGMPSGDIEAGVKSGQLESAASRIIPTWQYVLYHVVYLSAAVAVFICTQAAMTLPVALLSISVLYNWGIWASILCYPIYPVFGFTILLAYLTLLKRVVMSDTGGQYTIYTSVNAAKWQMLCLNIHMYQDFDAIKGSVFYNWYMRCMGTKVGKDVCCLGLVAHEFEQVTIGDGAVICEGSFLLTHTVENRQVKIRPIKIGDRATVGAHSCVLPDASLEDDATLDDMSLVMKGESIPRGSTWAGVPAYAVLTADIAKMASRRLSSLLSVTLSQAFSQKKSLRVAQHKTSV